MTGTLTLEYADGKLRLLNLSGQSIFSVSSSFGQETAIKRKPTHVGTGRYSAVEAEDKQ